MIFLVLAKVKVLHTLHASKSGAIGNHDNSIYIGPPASTYPSNNDVYSGGQMSSPFLDVRQVWYHDAPVSVVATTNQLL
jgi:hypothetical protein